MTFTFDTSALYAIVNRGDPDHDLIVKAREVERRPYVLPAGIVAEPACLVESNLPFTAPDGLLADLEAGAYTVDCGDGDFARIRHLVRRYEDLPLGFADAAVVACGERRGGRVLTLDRRDFNVVARDEGTISILP